MRVFLLLFLLFAACLTSSNENRLQKRDVDNPRGVIIRLPATHNWPMKRYKYSSTEIVSPPISHPQDGHEALSDIEEFRKAVEDLKRMTEKEREKGDPKKDAQFLSSMDDLSEYMEKPSNAGALRKLKADGFNPISMGIMAGMVSGTKSFLEEERRGLRRMTTTTPKPDSSKFLQVFDENGQVIREHTPDRLTQLARVKTSNQKLNEARKELNSSTNLPPILRDMLKGLLDPIAKMNENLEKGLEGNKTDEVLLEGVREDVRGWEKGFLGMKFMSKPEEQPGKLEEGPNIALLSGEEEEASRKRIDDLKRYLKEPPKTAEEVLKRRETILGTFNDNEKKLDLLEQKLGNQPEGSFGRDLLNMLAPLRNMTQWVKGNLEKPVNLTEVKESLRTTTERTTTTEDPEPLEEIEDGDSPEEIRRKFQASYNQLLKQREDALTLPPGPMREMLLDFLKPVIKMNKDQLKQLEEDKDAAPLTTTTTVKTTTDGLNESSLIVAIAQTEEKLIQLKAERDETMTGPSFFPDIDLQTANIKMQEAVLEQYRTMLAKKRKEANSGIKKRTGPKKLKFNSEESSLERLRKKRRSSSSERFDSSIHDSSEGKSTEIPETSSVKPNFFSYSSSSAQISPPISPFAMIGPFTMLRLMGMSNPMSNLGSEMKSSEAMKSLLSNMTSSPKLPVPSLGLFMSVKEDEEPENEEENPEKLFGISSHEIPTLIRVVPMPRKPEMLTTTQIPKEDSYMDSFKELKGRLKKVHEILGRTEKKPTDSPLAVLESMDSPISREKSSSSSSEMLGSPFGPLAMMTGLLSSVGKLSKMDDDDSSQEKEKPDFMGGSLAMLEEAASEEMKDDIKQTIQKSTGRFMADKMRAEHDDDPLSPIGTFTELVGTLFGKLASTIGSSMKADPMDRKSPFGIADLVGDSLLQLRGPHICIRESNQQLPKPENKTRSYQKECRNYGQAFKCTTKKVNEEGIQVSTRIQECCEGYTTTNIRTKGCNQKEAPKTPRKFLESVLDIIPHPEELNKTLENIPEGSTIIAEEDGTETIVFRRIFNDFDLEDGQILNSTDGKSYIVKIGPPKREFPTISLNCVPLKKTNIPIIHGGRGHISENKIHPVAETVLDILQNDGRFAKFLSILSEDTVAAFTNKTTSHTVLPFTDAAFEKFNNSTKEQIDNRIACIASGIARGHIFQPATCSGDLRLETRWPTRKIGGAEIIESDLVAFNGVVHIVDDIIVKENLESWDDKLKTVAPELEEQLRGKIEVGQPVTIFVPSSMLGKKGEDSDMENAASEGSGASPGISVEDALNQVIPWFLPSIKALPNSITTMGNTTIFAGNFKAAASPMGILSHRRKVLPCSRHAQIGCSRLIPYLDSDKDQLGACGASIFFLDKPIPRVSHSIESFLQSRKDLSIFNRLFEMIKENTTLPRISTIFVPVDDSFSVNAQKRLKGSADRASKFLKRHLVAQPICEFDFHAESIRPETVANKNGEHLKYYSQEQELFVEDCKILQTVIASNGIVHLIDSTIQVSSKSSTSLFSSDSAPKTSGLPSGIGSTFAKLILN